MQFDRSQQDVQADLLWAVSSPDLMQLHGCTEGLTSIADAPHISALSDWLGNNDHGPALSALVAERQPRRLGIYFEVLWQYVLENFPGFELSARNLPIYDKGRTIGELDFVYFCQQRQRFVHLETAVKFYLGVPTPSLPCDTPQPAISWSQWLGPGCKDRLDVKLLKMLNQQTRLSESPQGKQALAQLGATQPLREICLKGYLFYPLSPSKDIAPDSDKAEICQPPLNHHPQHAHGYWLKLSDMTHLTKYADCWQVMTKEQWLSPLFSLGEQELLRLSELESQIGRQLLENPFPIMIANMQATDEGFREKLRFFITPDDWPKL